MIFPYVADENSHLNYYFLLFCILPFLLFCYFRFLAIALHWFFWPVFNSLTFFQMKKKVTKAMPIKFLCYMVMISWHFSLILCWRVTTRTTMAWLTTQSSSRLNSKANAAKELSLKCRFKITRDRHLSPLVNAFKDRRRAFCEQLF